MFMAEQFTESHKEFQLSMNPDFDEDQEYLMDMNRYLDFSFKEDPTIAFIKTNRLEEMTEDQEKGGFDGYTYE